MTKYHVSFDIELNEPFNTQAWSSNHLLSAHCDFEDLEDASLWIPSWAQIEEIPEPFEPEWYGCYHGDELTWVKKFNSANDLKWHRSYLKADYQLMPIDIISKNNAQPAISSQKYQVGDRVGIKHVFEYNPHAGKVGKVVFYNPDWIGGTYRVKMQDSGQFDYFNEDRLELLERA